MSSSPSASALRAKHEKKIRETNEPSGKKDTVWTPDEHGTRGAHSNDGFQKQTARKPATGLPPKKSISQLP